MKEREDGHTFLVRCGAVAAMVAFVALVVLALLPRPLGDKHFEILTGFAQLSTADKSNYLFYLKTNFAVDSIYLLGHIIMWLGFSVVIGARSGILGTAVAVIGVSGAFLDFLENEMRWSFVLGLTRGLPADISGVYAWNTVTAMSYWTIIVAAVVTSIGVWSVDPRNKWLSFIGMAGLATVPFIYSSGHVATFLWIVLWHGAGAWFLWRYRAGRP